EITEPNVPCGETSCGLRNSFEVKIVGRTRCADLRSQNPYCGASAGFFIAFDSVDDFAVAVAAISDESRLNLSAVGGCTSYILCRGGKRERKQYDAQFFHRTLPTAKLFDRMRRVRSTRRRLMASSGKRHTTRTGPEFGPDRSEISRSIA